MASQKFTMNIYDRAAKADTVCTVVVEVDMASIAQRLAGKALRNKRGVSKIVAGAVVVKATRGA